MTLHWTPLAVAPCARSRPVTTVAVHCSVRITEPASVRAVKAAHVVVSTITITIASPIGCRLSIDGGWGNTALLNRDLRKPFAVAASHRVLAVVAGGPFLAVLL